MKKLLLACIALAVTSGLAFGQLRVPARQVSVGTSTWGTLQVQTNTTLQTTLDWIDDFWPTNIVRASAYPTAVQVAQWDTAIQEWTTNWFATKEALTSAVYVLRIELTNSMAVQYTTLTNRDQTLYSSATNISASQADAVSNWASTFMASQSWVIAQSNWDVATHRALTNYATAVSNWADNTLAPMTWVIAQSNWDKATHAALSNYIALVSNNFAAASNKLAQDAEFESQSREAAEAVLEQNFKDYTNGIYAWTNSCLSRKLTNIISDAVGGITATEVFTIVKGFMFYDK